MQQLQLLSGILLELDSAASMDVAIVSDSEYELNSVTFHGHVLRSFGSITAETNVHHIVQVCTTAASPC